MDLKSYNICFAANKKDLAAKSKGFNPPFIVMIPEGSTEVAENAFKNDNTVGMILLPNSVKKIRDGAFNGCNNLVHITIPDSVTEIGASAFFECSSLLGIDIPDTVTSLGANLFGNCTSLASVKFPKGLTEIVSDMFYGCRNLASIDIPESVTKIGGWAFSGCSGLSRIVIPQDVTSIGSYAFERCSNLTDIYIPSKVEGIGSSAFEDCTALTHINIPDSVVTIGDKAFGGCSNLKIVYSTNPILLKEKHPSKVMVVDPNMPCEDFKKQLKATYPSITKNEIKEEIDALVRRYHDIVFDVAEEESEESEEKAKEIDRRQLKLIKENYDKPMFAPQMRWNKKYRTKEFDGMTPYICINDLVNYKYVICAIPNDEAVTLLMEMNRRNVVKEYDSLESMVADGWRIGD